MENKKSALIYGIGGLLGIFFLTFLDQWTKHLAVLHLKGQEDIVWIPTAISGKSWRGFWNPSGTTVDFLSFDAGLSHHCCMDLF